MDKNIFWNLIEESKQESKHIEQQIEDLTIKLSQLDEQDIIGFEYRFREALDECDHFSILAAAKIIQGYVSDDSFLYLRCGIIAHGRAFLSKTIENPDNLIFANVRALENGEGFLYIADDAFTRKIGQNTNKPLPRIVALNYLNYEGYRSIKGEDWKEEDLPNMYPKLWAKFGEDNPRKHAIDELISKCFDS